MKNFYRHILWWFAFPFVAILNATLRQLIYKKPLGDLAAHQISTATVIVFFGIIFYFIFKRWKIEPACDRQVCKTRYSYWSNLASFNNSIRVWIWTLHNG
jgi:uncharacterized membrane protein